MKRLIVRVLPPPENLIVDCVKGYEGQEGVVVAIDQHPSPVPPYSYYVEVRFGDGEVRRLISDRLVPVDTSDVPETHRGSPIATNAWVFSTAALDVWLGGPPSNPKKYEEIWGVPWEDHRIYDVGRAGMKC